MALGNRKMDKTVLVGVSVVLCIFIGVVSGMVLSPTQQAEIMVQPWVDKADGYKQELVAGDSTEEEYIMKMWILEAELKWKVVILDTIMENPYTSVDEKREKFWTLFDYQPIRSAYGWKELDVSLVPTGDYPNTPNTSLVIGAEG